MTYADNRAGFLANTGAVSIGDLPLDTTGVASKTVGIATIVSDSGSLFFSNFSSRVAANEMIITGQEDFHVNFSAGVYAFSIDIYEPNFAGSAGCNASCVDTTFTLEFFAGSASVGKFTYNAPDDDGVSVVPSLGFFGVHSDVAINRVVVNDVTGNIDNEFFANFLSGRTPLVAQAVPAPSTLALTAAGLIGLFSVRRRAVGRKN